MGSQAREGLSVPSQRALSPHWKPASSAVHTELQRREFDEIFMVYVLCGGYACKCSGVSCLLVSVYAAYSHVHVCACMWEPEVGVQCLPQ